MSSRSEIIPDTARAANPAQQPAAKQPWMQRYFFVAMALLFVVLAVLGFAPSYASGIQTPKGAYEIPTMVHVHAVLMSAWLLLFVAQTGLAAAGALKWHRTLGMAAVSLAVALWISMVAVTANSLVRYKVEDFPWIYNILLVELMLVVLFPVFFVWGIQVRRYAAAHKRLLLLATLVLIQAAIDRIRWIPELPLPGFWSHAIRLYAVMLPLFVFDLVSLRRIHPITLAGTGIILSAHTIVSLCWGAPAWHDFVHAIVSAW